MTLKEIDDMFWDDDGFDLNSPEAVIMDKLIALEGWATWIPKFVYWLFENWKLVK